VVGGADGSAAAISVRGVTTSIQRSGRSPFPIERRSRHHLKWRARGIVEDDPAFVPGDDDDVVVRAGPLLDQRNHRTATLDLLPEEHWIAVSGARLPSPPLKIGGERGRPDSARAAIDKRREALGIEPCRAPVAQHHRGSGSST
jgi:hypothetical protein